MTVHTTRRQFLAGSAGLVIGVCLPSLARAQSGAAAVIRPDAEVDAPFEPNAFVRIGTDDTVTVLIKHIEFGQGPYTGLSTLVAEELDADWKQMRATAAPADVKLYANTLFGMQGTGGSTAMANSYTQMRKAGAAARAMLVSAAADEWGVDAQEITVSNGTIAHEKSGKSSGFGALAEAAAKVDPPVDPQLKDPKNFKLIGTDVPKLDSTIKSNGQAEFALDVYRDGMQTVAVLRPPLFGATVKSVDDAEAKAVGGVTKVAAIPQGVAVYADNTFAALKGRDALKAEWDESAAETRSSAQMAQEWRDGARKGGATAEESGDLDKALSDAATVLEAEYEFPFLAHAPMEPMDGVIEVKDGEAQVWLGAQLQTVDHAVIAGTLGLSEDKVKLHTMLAGGSFGRRAQPGSPVAAELAAIAKEGGDGAYKMIWTRGDDIKGGYYRPLTVHRLKAGLDSEGNIVAWQNDIANQSIVRGSAFEQLIQDGIDATAIEGSTKMPYAWPNHRVTWVEMQSPVPVLWWRSVGHTHTAYATETFLDEALEKGGKDAVEGRTALIKESPRDAGVLQRVADMVSWSGPKKGDGRALGLALHESFNSYVAMVAEVSNEEGQPRIHKIWAAVDCGVAVNPNVVRAQVEGGIGYGLSAALFDEITLAEGGQVEQSNFDDYRILRINEMPEIEVSIIESSEDPTGIGEPGVPPVAPAIANAWRVLTGETPRRLPFVNASAV